MLASTAGVWEEEGKRRGRDEEGEVESGERRVTGKSKEWGAHGRWEGGRRGGGEEGTKNPISLY